MILTIHKPQLLEFEVNLDSNIINPNLFEVEDCWFFCQKPNDEVPTVDNLNHFNLEKFKFVYILNRENSKLFYVSVQEKYISEIPLVEMDLARLLNELNLNNTSPECLSQFQLTQITELTGHIHNQISITIGDLHANLKKAIVLFELLGIMQFDSLEDRNKFFKIIKKSEIDITKEDMDTYSLILSKIIVYPTPIYLRFIGDIFGDRAGNDFMTLLFLTQLILKQKELNPTPQIALIIGNHDLQWFLLLFENGISFSVYQKAMDNQCLNINPQEFKVFIQQFQSLQRLGLMVDKNIVDRDDVDALIQELIPYFKLLDFDLYQDSFSFYAHTHVDFNLITRLENQLKTSAYHNGIPLKEIFLKKEPESIEEVIILINNINYYLYHLLQRKKLSSNLGPTYNMFENPLETITWLRNEEALNPENQKFPDTLSNKKINYIWGHDTSRVVCVFYDTSINKLNEESITLYFKNKKILENNIFTFPIGEIAPICYARINDQLFYLDPNLNEYKEIEPPNLTEFDNYFRQSVNPILLDSEGVRLIQKITQYIPKYPVPNNFEIDNILGKSANLADNNIIENLGILELYVTPNRDCFCHQIEFYPKTEIIEFKHEISELSFAFKHGHKALVELLLEDKPDLFILDSEKRTILILATINQHEKLIYLLAEKNLITPEMLNKQDIYGRTAIEYAIANGDLQISRILLKMGAQLPKERHKINSMIPSLTNKISYERVLEKLQNDSLLSTGNNQTFFSSDKSITDSENPDPKNYIK